MQDISFPSSCAFEDCFYEVVLLHNLFPNSALKRSSHNSYALPPLTIPRISQNHTHSWIDLESRVLLEFKARASHMQGRLRTLIEQPSKTPKFTELGFRLSKTPPLLQEALEAYFEMHRPDYAREVDIVHYPYGNACPIRNASCSFCRPVIEKLRIHVADQSHGFRFGHPRIQL